MIQYSRNCLEAQAKFHCGTDSSAEGVNTSKRVIIQRFERDLLQAFVDPQSFQGDAGIEVLSLEGSVLTLPYDQVKTVCFVKDFTGTAGTLDRKSFGSRPKTAGLWVRMRFRDGDSLEGVIPNNLLQIEPKGFIFSPPDLNINPQKVFVPRAALLEIEVLGVIGSSLRPKKGKPVVKEQLPLFE